MVDDKNLRGNNSEFVQILQTMTTGLLENCQRSTEALFRWSSYGFCTYHYGFAFLNLLPRRAEPPPAPLTSRSAAGYEGFVALP